MAVVADKVAAENAIRGRTRGRRVGKARAVGIADEAGVNDV